MFYLFRQNNSWGTFDFAYGHSVEVWIEADSAEDANYAAESKGIYFDGVDNCLDCECCGDRWHEASEYDAKESVPEFVSGYFRWNNCGPEGFVHYKDGSVYSLPFVRIDS